MERSEVAALAAAMPEVTSAAHFDRTAYKVGGKIFATLGAQDLNLRLPQEQQRELMAITAAARPCAGAWGRSGWTAVGFEVDPDDLETWLVEAWRHRAPPKVRAAHQL